LLFQVQENSQRADFGEQRDDWVLAILYDFTHE